MYGFYTTTNKKQAINFALKVYKRRKEENPIVNIYEIYEEKAFKECTILMFDSADGSWLDFVSDNRLGKTTEKKYDFVYGPGLTMIYIYNILFIYFWHLHKRTNNRSSI